jgi:hypothetical protein
LQSAESRLHWCVLRRSWGFRYQYPGSDGWALLPPIHLTGS